MDGHQVATLAGVQHPLLAPAVARFAHGTHHVVAEFPPRGAQVLDVVPGLVQGRTDEVVHTCVEDGELLLLAHLHIKHAADQMAALGHQRTTRLEMDVLAGTDHEVAADHVEIVFEVRDRVAVRILVVHAEAATQVEVTDRNLVLDEPLLQFLDAAAEEGEDGHLGNLGAHVEMQADQFDVRALRQQVRHILEGPGADAEFVLLEAGADVFMGMGVDVGIHADRDPGLAPHRGRQVVDDPDFRHALAVEAEDAGPQGGLDFLVGLADAGIDYFLGIEARLDGEFHLVAAHAVGTQAVVPDDVEDRTVGVGLQGVMGVPAVFVDLLPVGVQRLAQEVQVVEIERRFDRFESFDLLLRYHSRFLDSDISCKDIRKT